jgi:hypothetical protein
VTTHFSEGGAARGTLEGACCKDGACAMAGEAVKCDGLYLGFPKTCDSEVCKEVVCCSAWAELRHAV